MMRLDGNPALRLRNGFLRGIFIQEEHIVAANFRALAQFVWPLFRLARARSVLSRDHRMAAGPC